MLTPTLLLILDGYGLAESSAGNAITQAKTPHLHQAFNNPTELQASGLAVGLPEGYMGNSEVGHLNLGAGRVVYQDLARIDVAIRDHEFETNPVLVDLLAKIKASGGRLQLLGLLSDGGVHSHVNHIKALLKLAKEHGIETYYHAFMDGRDTGPQQGVEFMADLQATMESLQSGQVASMVGRFYAMDRDKRYERVQVAYDLLVQGLGQASNSATQSLRDSYAAEITDEFIKPHIFIPQGCIKDGDGVFFFNFRADRARELTSAFILPDFKGFVPAKRPHLVEFATMTSYDELFKVPVAYTKDNLDQTLGEVVSGYGAQLRLAETEKYAHVTYFFSGGREEIFKGEDRLLVPSTKEVETYDLKPEMSVYEITEKLIAALQSKKYLFLVCNLANPDMVGHTGKLAAAIQALQAVDECVAKIMLTAEAEGVRLLMTADHGNIEEMLTAEGKPQTSHTRNLVPLVAFEAGKRITLQPRGKLADIAPTILGLWDIKPPTAMTGTNLANLANIGL